jgi:Protein of unknown function (DUF2795)
VENVAGIDPYLAGANFPATKQQLVARAYSNGATADLLAAFHALPEREYVSANDVARALPYAS